MVGQNGYRRGKIRARTSVEGHMYYDHRGYENNSNKSAGDVLGSANTWDGGGVCSIGGSIRLPRPDLRNLGIGYNQIRAKDDKVDNKFIMIKDHITLGRTFGKYQIVIPTREEWE